jgi:hypothetical protein
MTLANEELLDSIAEANAVEFINEQGAAGKWQSS